MKLLFCEDCLDLFNLRPEMKSCKCGLVKGRYIDNVHAETNGQGYALAIGNGSLYEAMMKVHTVKEDFRQTGDVYRRHPTSIVCWARPHEGPANSHTRVNPDL